MSTQAYPPTPPEPPSAAAAGLTPRELQVLHGMARGLTNVQIGREMHLSEGTIRTHCKKLLDRIGVPNRTAAVAWGFRTGVLS